MSTDYEAIMELRTEVRAQTVAEIPALRCPGCGAEIGHYEQDESGRVCLRVSNLRVWRLDGRCAECGEEWHYHYSEKAIESLIKRLKSL
jgi:hypothetical protein